VKQLKQQHDAEIKKYLQKISKMEEEFREELEVAKKEYEKRLAHEIALIKDEYAHLERKIQQTYSFL
jgi:aspartate/tyrosine/aromatic aminotransferase